MATRNKPVGKPQSRAYDFPTTGGPGWTFGVSECDQCHKPTTNLRTYGSYSQKVDLCKGCHDDNCKAQRRGDIKHGYNHNSK
jgi:predicted CXXCH cytochrome family protein